MVVLGHFFDWELPRIVLLGFVTSLSSTAVVVSYLEAKGLLPTRLGRDVIGVLLAQDILIAPMIIIVSALGGTFSPSTLSLQIIGTVLIGFGLFFILRKRIVLPKIIRGTTPSNDHKLFIALILCFGAALLTNMFHLSLGLGAFIGGTLVSNINNFSWVKEELHSFKTLFVALFFVSIGLLINVDFFIENFVFILTILIFSFIINTFVNASVFLWLKRSWRYSIYAGALLAPMGEFSFFLASAGLQIGAIGEYAYQTSILVIALSLILSPLWTQLFINKENHN